MNDINEEKKEIIVSLIQDSLMGKIDPSANFNPQFLADAILKKLEFKESMAERNTKSINEAISKFNTMIEDIDNDMETEMEQLGVDEVLLKNFIKGQLTACEKLKNQLETI